MDKNEEKIKYLLEHINEGKAADELNSDFEKWYQEECIVRKFNERVEALKKQKRKFSEFAIEYGYQYDYDRSDDWHCYEMHFDRSILFKDFVTLLQLKYAELYGKQHICVRIYNKSKGGYLGSISFDSMCEMDDEKESNGLLLKYGDHHIATHAICKFRYSRGPYDSWVYRILISDDPMPNMRSLSDEEYLKTVYP